MNNSELNICFISNTKSVFDDKFRIEYTEIEYETTFKNEISIFQNLSLFDSHDLDRVQIWKCMQHCIFGYMIKQSYFKKRKSRIKLFFTKFKNKISNAEEICNDELISFRSIGIGSTFTIYLDYYITKGEFKIDRTRN